MKKIGILMLCLLLLLTLVACGNGEAPPAQTATPAPTTNAVPTPEGEDQTPVRIGITTVLTGDRAMEGEFARNAASIVEQEINDAGGVLGRPLELVIEDAMGTDVGAVNAFRRLAADDSIVAIIGSNSSNDNIAISGSVLEFEILTTVQGSSPRLRDLANYENPWMFQLRTTDDVLCSAMINYAVNVLGLRSFAVINDTETASSDQARLFIEALEEHGIEPAVVVPFSTGTTDFSAHLARIQNANVDGILAASFHTEAAILMEQMRAMGMEHPVFGSNAYADPVTISLAGEALEGVYSVTSWVPTTVMPLGQAFAQRYFELFGTEAASSASQIYDHVLMIVEAIERAGTTERQAVRDAMWTIYDFEGAITIYDTRTNGAAGRGGLLLQVQNMIPVIIEAVFA